MKVMGVFAVLFGVILLILAIPQVNTLLAGVGGAVSAPIATMFAFTMVLAILGIVVAVVVAVSRV